MCVCVCVCCSVLDLNRLYPADMDTSTSIALFISLYFCQHSYSACKNLNSSVLSFPLFFHICYCCSFIDYCSKFFSSIISANLIRFSFIVSSCLYAMFFHYRKSFSHFCEIDTSQDASTKYDDIRIFFKLIFFSLIILLGKFSFSKYWKMFFLFLLFFFSFFFFLFIFTLILLLLSFNDSLPRTGEETRSAEIFIANKTD